jgi:hypothetical protein
LSNTEVIVKFVKGELLTPHPSCIERSKLAPPHRALGSASGSLFFHATNVIAAHTASLSEVWRGHALPYHAFCTDKDIFRQRERSPQAKSTV